MTGDACLYYIVLTTRMFLAVNTMIGLDIVGPYHVVGTSYGYTRQVTNDVLTVSFENSTEA